jgi:hypothetical protein
MIEVTFIVVPLAGVGDGAVIAGDQSPPPIALPVLVFDEPHWPILLFRLEMNARHTTHLFRYRYAGAEWVLELKATDADDARARLGALTWATYEGVVIETTPAILSPLRMLSVWLRNAAKRFLN